MKLFHIEFYLNFCTDNSADARVIKSIPYSALVASFLNENTAWGWADNKCIEYDNKLGYNAPYSSVRIDCNVSEIF